MLANKHYNRMDIVNIISHTHKKLGKEKLHIQILQQNTDHQFLKCV